MDEKLSEFFSDVHYMIGEPNPRFVLPFFAKLNDMKKRVRSESFDDAMRLMVEFADENSWLFRSKAVAVRACARMAQGEWDLALRDFSKIVEPYDRSKGGFNDMPKTLLAYCKCLFMVGDYEKTVKAISAYIYLRDWHGVVAGEAVLIRGDAYMKMGKVYAAHRDYEDAFWLLCSEDRRKIVNEKLAEAVRLVNIEDAKQSKEEVPF